MASSRACSGEERRWGGEASAWLCRAWPWSVPTPLSVKAASAGGTGGAFAPVGGAATPTAVLSYAAPVANDAVAVTFQQAIAASDALRTGSYGKTLTLTLSTTTS